MTIRLSRRQWGATALLGPAMRLPARGFFIHHSVTLADDYDAVLEATDDVAGDMREIERVGLERFGRFPYSWAYHPSGVELEGAGHTVGAHTKGYNATWLALVLIGNYEDHDPTGPQLAAMAERIREELAAGRVKALGPGGTVLIHPHRQVRATACPGGRMVDRLDDLAALVTNPPTEEDPDMEYLATVTLDEEITTRDGLAIPAGTHVFRCSGAYAVHVGEAGAAWARGALHPAELTVVDADGFLDAHIVIRGAG